MIPALFIFQLKQEIRWLILALFLSAVLGAVAVFLYQPEYREQIASLVAQHSALAVLLGAEGNVDLPLTIHLFSMLYQFIFPFFFIVNSIMSSQRLVAIPLESNWMSYLLAARHRRISIVVTLFLVMGTETFFVLVVCMFSQILAAIALFSQNLDVIALLRLNFGFFLTMLPLPALSMQLAFLLKGSRKFRNYGVIVLGSFFALWLFSRFSGWTNGLKYFTPFSLFSGMGLLTANIKGFQLSLLALPLTLMILLISSSVFARRQL